jgi:hypothetical protein
MTFLYGDDYNTILINLQKCVTHLRNFINILNEVNEYDDVEKIWYNFLQTLEYIKKKTDLCDISRINKLNDYVADNTLDYILKQNSNNSQKTNPLQNDILYLIQCLNKKIRTLENTSSTFSSPFSSQESRPEELSQTSQHAIQIDEYRKEINAFLSSSFNSEENSIFYVKYWLIYPNADNGGRPSIEEYEISPDGTTQDYVNDVHHDDSSARHNASEWNPIRNLKRIGVTVTPLNEKTCLDKAINSVVLQSVDNVVVYQNMIYPN